MWQKWIAKAFGTKNDRELKKIRPLVEQINALESAIQALDDDGLRAKTAEFKVKLANGATLDDILPDAFAVTREAARRRLGQRHYDVQLIGGIALHKGMIAEMRTGEGKTLVATLPAYLNALAGRGTHVVTVNDYLAQRDCEWMSQVYNYLGLTTGVVTTSTPNGWQRQQAYRADITYGQNNELGFDYLRDNMKFSLDQYVHRYLPNTTGRANEKLLPYAIVDEVDSILIDEARTPLIISGNTDDSPEPYMKANVVVQLLKRDLDYNIDEKAHSVTLTESGVDRVEARLKVGNLYDAENMPWLHFINAALKAHTLYRNGVNYLIEEGKVIIIDEHTGRKMPGRRWSDGIHQSIEAKEGVQIQQETQTLATVTFQNYFRMYEKLCGMTGTAITEAEEFGKIYNLEVLEIPTNKPRKRLDHDDVIYKTERAKFKSVIGDIAQANEKGQPVLVGTISVEKSEFLSHLLTERGIAHNVLNAKQHAREAEIVAQAGRFEAVTISTNMAGRGTDILLGGNPELLARQEVFGPGKVHEHFDETNPEYLAGLERYRGECAEEKQRVLTAGGLYIIGTERHESRRIDNQLRGRAGRQGDPGESKFYLSLDDDLMRVFGGDRVRKIMEWLKIPEDEPIIDKMVSKAIEGAQKRVEGQHFDARKSVLEYDDVMNLQRKAIYALRRRTLAVDDTLELVTDAIANVVLTLVDKFCPQGQNPLDWNLEPLEDAVFQLTNLDLDLGEVLRNYDALVRSLSGTLKDEFVERRDAQIARIADSMTPERGDQDDEDQEVVDEDALAANATKEWIVVERQLYLEQIDTHWREHLKIMDGLKEGVYLEAYAQKDPKLIYKKEGYELFRQMIERIEADLTRALFHVEVQGRREIDRMAAEAEARRVKAARAMREQHEVASLHDEAEHTAEGGQAAPADQARLRAVQAQKAAQLRAIQAAQLAQDAMAESDDGEALPAPPVDQPPKVETYRRERPKIGRNDPCWCGSGKKYKKCHGANEDDAGIPG